MDKKVKLLSNSKEAPHRHCHSSHGSNFQRSNNFSGRFSQLDGKPLDKISDSKSKKASAMRRPKTHPELLDREKKAAAERTPWLNLETLPPFFRRKVAPAESANSSAKLLVNVTVSHSIGPLRVLVSDDVTVLELIKAALLKYGREGRRPILSSNPHVFGLHYSQFSIDCLNPEEKIKELGCRNFFLCPKTAIAAKEENNNNNTSGSCRSEMEIIWRITEPWDKLWHGVGGNQISIV